MDSRWVPVNRDSQRGVKVILHPRAAIYDVRRGTADDAVDLSEFVKEASHTAFEASVTVAFNRELFGSRQPKPNQVLEIQLQQRGEWQSIWLGFVDSISSFTMSRGERQMQFIAKTRDQLDIWRSAIRVTPLFPQLTNLSYMAQRIARMTDMKGDEIALPPTGISTAHSNTQFAGMTAWDMLQAVFVALGWTPFIDVQGRLRAADRTLHGRTADIVLSDDRMVKVGGQRQRPSVSRVKVSWLDPTLKKWKQQGRMITSVPVTIGWFLKTHEVKVTYSEDGTLRAENTRHKANPSVEKWSGLTWCHTTWTARTAVEGRLFFDNTTNFRAFVSLAAAWVGFTVAQEFFPGLVPAAAISQAAFTALLLKMGPGVYEIWGTPYDYVHAKNASEAFDASVPSWVNNTQDIDCDLIMNEEHGRAVAVRELIYSTSSASKWSLTIVDDPRIEYGDLLKFPDGSLFFVEDFTRTLTRGSEATLDLKGFVLVKAATKSRPMIPPGTIMVGGWGDGFNDGGHNEPGPFYFLSPDGSQKYTAASNPMPGTGLSALARLSTGNIAQVGGNAPYFPASGAGVWRGTTLTRLSEFLDDGEVQRQDGKSVTADALGNWYTSVVVGSAVITFLAVRISRLNAASEVLTSWSIPLPPAYDNYTEFPGAQTLAVTEDGHTMYMWLRKADVPTNTIHCTVHVFSLEGTGSYLRQISTDFTENPGYQSLLCVPDGSGDVLVAFDRVNPPSGLDPDAVGALRRYKQDGTLVWEAVDPEGPGPFYWMVVALGLPGDTHFLANAYTNDETYSNTRYVWMEYATGLPDNSRNFAPEDGKFEFDSQTVVMSVPAPSADDTAGGGAGGGGGDGGAGGGGTPGTPTIPNHGFIVQGTLSSFVSPVVPASQEEEGKAQLTRAAAWDIYQQDPNIRLLQKETGTNVAGLSVDIVVQQGNGDFADIATSHDNGDGTVTIVAQWSPHVGDSNTMDSSRWVPPTQALADMAGPMTPVTRTRR